MSQSEGPNPERRSNGALICFGLGASLAVIAWFLGIGGVMTTAFAGGDPAMLTGGILMVIALVLATLAGMALMLIGGLWMIAQVISDQRGEPSEKRYRDVER